MNPILELRRIRAVLTAAEYVVSIQQGFEMFKVRPFSGLASGLVRLLEPIGPLARRALASLLLSIHLFERREF